MNLREDNLIPGPKPAISSGHPHEDAAWLEPQTKRTEHKRMDLHFWIAGTILFVFFGWFGHARAHAATGRPAPSKDVFPQSIEVIPGKLKVRIFLHEIKYEKETISCWSYVTDGLVAQKQKEIIFTLRRASSQKPEDYPRDFLELFATIFRYAERGQTVDIGDSTLFGETGFLGHKDFRGIGYIAPEGFPGVETGRVPLLAGILLKEDEAQIAWDLGLTRVTALLGMKYHYYPCPTWSDLKRESVASRRAMDDDLLGKIAGVGVRANYYEERNHIFLSVSPSSQTRLEKLLRGLPPTQPLALRTQPDSRANACLVWHPGEPMAITPPGSNGSRKTGAFLAFVPEQDANEVRMVEDGFSLFLTNSTWQKIREALLSGSDILIPSDAKAGTSISVEWAKPSAYTSPVTGETYVAEKWTTYEPESSSPAPKQRVAVRSKRTVLLTSDQDLQAYTTAEDLAGYVNAIESAVDTFFAPPERRNRHELTIQLALAAEGHEVRIVAAPVLSADVEEDLQKRLESVPAPKVGGPVKLDFILSVWSVASVQ